MMPLVLALLVLLLAIMFWMRHSYGYWKRRSVYTLPPTPIFGNATNVILLRESFGSNFRKFYQHCRDEGKLFAGYYLFMKPIFVPIDSDLIKRMLSVDNHHFSDHPGLVNEKDDPLSTNLFVTKSERWKVLRPLLSPSFSSRNVRTSCKWTLKYAKQLMELVDEMVSISEGKGIDIKEVCQRYTTDLSVAFTMGMESNYLKDANSPFKRCNELIFGVSLKQSCRLLCASIMPEFYGALKMKMFDSEITAFFTDIVLKLQSAKRNGQIPDCLVHRLMDGSGWKNGVSTEEAIAQCYLIFLAGVETTSATISFTLFELASQPHIQEKVRSDITKVLNATEDITYEKMKGLDYTDQCVLETIRKYSAAPINTRVCTETYQVPNSTVILEKGTQVIFPHQGVHMDPKYFPDPERYDPDRFLESNTENDTSVFLPFGIGPRTCLGSVLGMLQIKIALAILLFNFRFSVHPDTKMPIKMKAMSFFHCPDPPLRLIVERL